MRRSGSEPNKGRLAMTTATAQPYAVRAAGSTRLFLRHYGEMILAMYGGMIGLGALFALILAGLGTTPEAVRYDLPVLFALVMCFNMTAGMVFWMRHRGHSRSRIVEMAGAMVAPAIAAIVLFWTGAVEAGAVCPIECIAMVPAMLAAMLVRRDEYSRPGHM